MSQYNYSQMANQVVHSDRRLQNEDSTAPVSLAGRISAKDMGTRHSREKPAPKGYEPTNDTTAHVYESLMVRVAQILPDTSHEVVVSAADTVLDILKSDASTTDKRKEIGQQLGTQIDSEQMHELVSLADRISDWVGGDMEGIEMDEIDEVDEVDEVEEDEKDEKDEIDMVDNVDMVIETPHPNPVPLNIDAFFIQRKLAERYEAHEAEKLGGELLRVLADEELDERAVENEMMEVLDYDHFDVVQMLLENRWDVVYGVQKDMARGEAALEELESKMKRVREKEGGREEEKMDEDTQKQSHGPISSDHVSEHVPAILDLESLQLDPHIMATTKVHLPEGSTQVTKKSYDVITIPPPPPLVQDDPIVSIKELPQWAQSAFSGTTSFNRIQSRVFPAAFGSDDNILMCAPTGAGKTNVAMLAVLRVMANHMRGEKLALKEFKVVYIAPLKALVQEQVREFSTRLGPYGVVVNELTGDASLSRLQMEETNVLVTTPEKWDVVTRKPNPLVGLVRLVVVDEIHLLHDVRGPVLESVVARALRQGMRVVGLSATLPNYRDVAQFLRVKETGLFYFDSRYRPCPLEQQFVGIKERSALKRVMAMNEACVDKVRETIEQGHQLIVFVHSRADTYRSAKGLKDIDLKLGGPSLSILSSESENVKNKHLSEILPSGIGIHHAGLNKDERSLVEDLFAAGHLRVLVSTATLAWGVNLPAHTVIIKGTETYNPEMGSWQQLSPQDVLQMLGRAGRPRYDRSGEGIIITSHDEVQYYLAVLNQQLPIESQMVARLVDSINAEVVAGTIKSLADGVRWLGETYLYVRMLRSPGVYKVGAGEDDRVLTKRRTDLVHTALTTLAQCQMVRYEAGVVPTEMGRIAAHYYITHTTMRLYGTSLRPWFTESDVLRVFAQSDEFRYLTVRQEEKAEVARLIERSPIPVRESAGDSLAKVSCLLQTHVSRLVLDGFALVADMVYITQSAGRLLRALFEVALRKKWASLARLILNMCKCVERRQWTASSPLRQLKDVPRDILRATEASHIPFIRYFDASPEELAEALNLRGSSSACHALLRTFPRLKLSYLVQPLTSSMLRIQVGVVPDWTWTEDRPSEQFFVFVEDPAGEVLVHHDVFTVRRSNIGKDHLVELCVPWTDPRPPAYFVSFISARWLHSTWTVAVQLADVPVPSKFAPYTEPVGRPRAVENAIDDLAGYVSAKMLSQNQAQVFPALYHTAENVFVGTTDSTVVCAELALLSHFRQNKGRAVYVHPDAAHVRRLAASWASFSALGKRVACMTGDIANDVSVLGNNHLVLATTAQLGSLARRWRQRKVLHAIELLVADGVHKMDQYETLLTRMRMVRENFVDMRVVALGVPMGGARDVGDWLGVRREHVYNFASQKRVVISTSERSEGVDKVLSTSEQSEGVDKVNKVLSTSERSEGVEKVNKVLSTSEVDKVNKVLSTSEVDKVNKVLSTPSLRSVVFCPDYPSATLTSTQLLSYDRPIPPLDDPTLHQLCSGGVGLLHTSTSDNDRAQIERLFSEGTLHAIVATKDAIVPMADSVVILANTDARRYSADYTSVEVMQMMAHSRGAVSIVVPDNKVELYRRYAADGALVESSMNLAFADVLCEEITARNVRSPQDAVDWLSFTYLYRRMRHNPGYYEATGVNEGLSEVVEKSIEELLKAELVEEEEEELVPTDSSLIAAHHGVRVASMKHIMQLSNKSRIRNMLQVLSQAAEFENLEVREGDAAVLAKIYNSLPVQIPVDFDTVSGKVLVLLQAHMSRIPVAHELAVDQKYIISNVLPLVGAAIDTLASEGHLNALQMMEVAQMVVQGVWNTPDAPLRQIPHFSDAIIARCRSHSVETVYDIMALEDDVRDEILQLDEEVPQDAAKLEQIAAFVNKYPNIDLSCRVEGSAVVVLLERDEEPEDLLVESSRFPGKRTEGWWIVVGDASSRQLYGIKRTKIDKERQEVRVEFTVPGGGEHELMVWCVCDGYVDADKEVRFKWSEQTSEQ